MNLVFGLQAEPLNLEVQLLTKTSINSPSSMRKFSVELGSLKAPFI